MIIAVSSEHRQDSLQAVAFAIDTLKANVPIWKKVGFLSVLDEGKRRAVYSPISGEIDCEA